MYKHILVAIGPGLSESALTTAIACARKCSARLTALHIVDQTPWWAVITAYCSTADTHAIIDDRARAITRHCARMIERAGIDGIARSVALPLYGATVGAIIADEARRIDANLIVLGGEAETGYRHGEARLRDVVCTRSACDVLIAAHDPAHQHVGIKLTGASAGSERAA